MGDASWESRQAGAVARQVEYWPDSRSLVRPLKAHDEANLRYAEWEYTRHLKVEAASSNHIGYVHLSAMSSNDINQRAREFIPYPIVKDSSSTSATIGAQHLLVAACNAAPQGMVLLAAARRRSAVEHAGCLRGHIVVLCDQETASDGEALAEGFKRFHMGEVIGTRTWGSEIWLSGSNVQADNGVATTAETGVYGPEGKWLIEGHGVDPDVVVDNPPHAAAAGADAQLQTAVDLLRREIQADPRPVPAAPSYPDKAFKY